MATRRMSGGAGLVFKGSGFYLTDYGKNAHRNERDGQAGREEGERRRTASRRASPSRSPSPSPKPSESKSSESKSSESSRVESDSDKSGGTKSDEQARVVELAAARSQARAASPDG